MPRMRRVVQLGLVIGGTVLLVGLVRSIGLAELIGHLRLFGYGLVAAIAFELAVDACNTMGWRHTFAEPIPVRFWRLFWIRQAGTAVNRLTPTATLGGEVVKATLVRPYLSTPDVLASLIAARTSHAIAQAILVLVGLTFLLTRLEHAPNLTFAAVLGFVVTSTGIGAFVLLQQRGMFAALAERAIRLGLHRSSFTWLRADGAALDRRLADFFRARPRAFVACLGWHLAGQLLAVVQLFFILAWLGTPASPVVSLAIEAFAVILDSALFFVPARIGIQEGGHVLIITTLGFSAATGLAVALIVRLSQLAAAALGLGAYWLLPAGEHAARRLDLKGVD